MKDILDKITSYNLFNYLLPGVLFVVILDQFTPYSLVQEDLVVGAFVYYFVGLVISRFGSLIVEPILKWTSFLEFAQYPDFVTVSKLDTKIEAFSETNNMYRTFVAMFTLLLVLKGYELIALYAPFLNEYALHILTILLFLMFLLSYRKQTTYVRKRIEANKS